jgi:hypothetical protein
MLEQVWSGDLKQQRPDDQVKADLGCRRRLIMTAQAKPPLQPEHGRERARNQQQIVEITMEETRVEVWLQQKPVADICSRANQTERICEVTEHFSEKRENHHSDAHGHTQFQ